MERGCSIQKSQRYLTRAKSTGNGPRPSRDTTEQLARPVTAIDGLVVVVIRSGVDELAGSRVHCELPGRYAAGSPVRRLCRVGCVQTLVPPVFRRDDRIAQSAGQDLRQQRRDQGHVLVTRRVCAVYFETN